ncbi:hypothetical protein BH20ACI1_BH20ACI1_29660 [soil metagenome]
MFKKLLLLFTFIFCLFLISDNQVSAQTASNQATIFKSKTERNIRKEILSLPYYDVFDAIGYQINGDTVTLSGDVVRPLTKDDAEESVKDIDGVRNVVNNIKVLPLSPSDDRIRVRIYRAIGDQGSLYRYLLGTNPAIRIIVNNGRVSLEGIVANETDKNLAGIAAKEIFGVFGVENNLQIEKREGERIN